MLLDFNLAADSTRRDRDAAGVGGTLPYMAPEHLEAFRGGAGRRSTAGATCTALGVILSSS